MQSNEDLLKYLQTLDHFHRDTRGLKDGWAYASYEGLVAAEGTAYEPPRKARPYGSGIRKMRDKLCFSNALTVADRRGLTYVEGFAGSIIPVMHAWVVDENGLVIDPTWKEPGHSYIGIPFTSGEVWGQLAQTHHYGVLASDWMNDGAILRHGLDYVRKHALGREVTDVHIPA